MAVFDLGTIEITPGAGAALAAARLDPAGFLARHRQGDWGVASERRRDQNALALRHGSAVTSIFRLAFGVDLLVRTAGDRSRTLVLLVAEDEPRELGTREGYAAWAASYDRDKNALIAVEESRVVTLLAALPVTAALDAGTGTGRHALALARRGAAVTAIDQSLPMLAVARRAARADDLPVRFGVASLADGLPFTPGVFDLVVCALVLCHVPDLASAIREFGRVLHPGGHLLLTDFHPAAVARGWRTHFSHAGRTHLLPNMPHARADYLAAATAAGLQLRTVLDAPVRDVPAGYFSDALVREDGDLPFCLLLLAQKPPEQGEDTHRMQAGDQTSA